jgi:cell division GTPase FtsZ
VIFGVRVDRKYDGILRVLAIMTGVRSPMVESVGESVAIADVVSDPKLRFPIEPEFPRKNRGR